MKRITLTKTMIRCNRTVLGVMSVLAISACALQGEGKNSGEASQDLSPNACTAVTLTSPAQNFVGIVGGTVPLAATATCPPGQTPEYQYWEKLAAAPNWTLRGPYVPGASTWSPSSADDWCVTVVARAIGAPDDYQTRASSRCGAIHVNHNPTAVDDTLSTTKNSIGAVNVIVNDSDVDGDSISVTAFTQPAHGAAAIAPTGVAFYLPDINYVGADSFTYTLTDFYGASSIATVNVTVSP